MSIESVMLSNYLILCCPLLLLPSVFPSIRIFSNESAVCIRWPKDWSFSFSISPSNEHSGLASFRIVWPPCCPRDSQESSPAQFETINSWVLSLLYGPTLISKPSWVPFLRGRQTTCTVFWNENWLLSTPPPACIKGRLTAEELMLLNCGIGEDSWEYLGLQGDQTSQS